MNLTPARLVEACKNDDSLLRIAKDVAEDLITRKTYDIAGCVDQLGFALTSTSVDDRVNGTCLLSAVLAQLPKDFLNEQQLQYLATFYADRLKDNHNVIPAVINGIEALVHMSHLPRSCAPELLRSFFQNTTCQSQMRSDRIKIFAILKYMSEQYVEELKNMTGDFLYGVINSIDGERDPRNLAFIFDFMPDFIERYPLLHLSEDMFEIFACYFPIDFNPSKTDPNTITRDDLAANLARCLAATPEFVEWTITLALEKLDSDLTLAKLDSLQLLTQAALRFPALTIEPYFDQLWTALRGQLLLGSDTGPVAQAALHTLRTLLERASLEPDWSHNAQTLVLGHILPHLSEPTHRLFEPATAIALVCISGDPQFAGDKILNSFLITLRTLNDEGNNVDDDVTVKVGLRVKIFTILSRLFKIVAIRGDGQLQSINSATCMELHSHVITILRCSIGMGNVDNDDNDQQRLKVTVDFTDLIRSALSVLNESVPIINELNRVLVYQILVYLIIHESYDLNFTQLLEQLGALHPIELQSNCIDICISSFDKYTHFVQRKVLKNLHPLVKQMAFAQRILDLIMRHVFEPLIPVDVRLLALEALNELLVNEDQRFVEELQHNSCLIDRLIKLAKEQNEQLTTPIDKEYHVLEQIAAALTHTVQVLAVAEQYTIISEFLPQLNLQLASDLFVAKGLLGYLHKDISLDDHFERLLTDLSDLALHSEDEHLRKVAHHLICSLVNKIEHNKTNCGHLSHFIHKVKEEVRGGSILAVELLAWLAKGLSVRGADEADDILETLADLLKHPTLGNAASLAFEVISAEFPQLHLPVVKFLFKQKRFHTIMKKLRDDLLVFGEHHMNAFIYVLEATPHAVVRIHIVEVGPTLFKCLEKSGHNPHTICIALSICERFVKQTDEYFRAHLQHLIPSCLELSSSAQSMSVRIKALNLLTDVCRYPVFVLLPHKVDVVLALSIPLDDTKRLVRNAAVHASNAWNLIGTVTADEASKA